jgi:hypothetical protein
LLLSSRRSLGKDRCHAIAFGDGRSRRKGNEGGSSCEQTSLYAKIDIFFPVHGNGDYGWSAVGKQMLNSLLSLPAVAGEVFRSLDTTPFPISGGSGQRLRGSGSFSGLLHGDFLTFTKIVPLTAQLQKLPNLIEQPVYLTLLAIPHPRSRQREPSFSFLSDELKEDRNGAH